MAFIKHNNILYNILFHISLITTISIVSSLLIEVVCILFNSPFHILYNLVEISLSLSEHHRWSQIIGVCQQGGAIISSITHNLIIISVVAWQQSLAVGTIVASTVNSLIFAPRVLGVIDFVLTLQYRTILARMAHLMLGVVDFVLTLQYRTIFARITHLMSLSIAL